MKQKVLFGISLCSLLVLTGCVSEQTYVGSDKPVSDRTFDNIEAARTRISLGLNYLRRGDTSQAKYNLERARSFAPNSAEVHSALAYYYQSVGENKQAEEYFRLAIQKDANYADAYNNYGAFLCQLERYDEAEQLLLKAISRPGYIRVAESYENLALCQLQQNNFNKAKGYLDSSTSHNTTRITSLTMSAGLSYAMGDNRGAKALLDRIQRLGRVSARTVLLSYLIAEKNGDQETLRNAEQLLLTLYTDTPETRLLLQKRLQDSEFEQLRERYKDSLMANIVLPDEDAEKPELPASPLPNPKLKVVKRKTASDNTAPEQSMANTAPDSSVAELHNATSAIAGSLAAQTTAVISPATAVAALPTETELQQAAAQMAATTEPEPIADQPVKAVAADDAATLVATQAPATQSEVTQSDTAATEAETVPTEAELTETALAEMAQSETTPTEMAAVEALTVEVTQSNTAHADAAQTETAETEATATEIASQEQVQTAPAADTAFHIVQAAESLYAISVKHNIRLQRLMQWNQLSPDSVIKTGQKIWLGPVSEEELNRGEVQQPALAQREQAAAVQPYHVVAAGETMFGISYRYNVRLSSFMAWNNLTEQSTLQVGQQVYVVDPASVAQ
ncbi:type IV pilus biogenesis/stability protein PilW [Rheinheimera pleomorphica]|uniref:type IV pilus biogenesis/stability protein PilW n=1 Tax=Rheinheimera pleomorphica TaxID=2703963 RepID=UPI001F511877|nr:type IV pilus biogenesis/stability protein PilW [Rheinheimera pleomorphica]